MQQSTSLFHKLKALTNGRVIEPKLDRIDASALAIQYQSYTNSDIQWNIRKCARRTAAAA